VPPNGNEADYLVGAADLRTIVDELWLAGAEAVAVNDERVTTSTAIIDIGGSVLVNAAYLAGPYQIKAIGPTDLFAKLSASPASRSSSGPAAGPSASASHGPSRRRWTSRRSPVR
jgi:uncharacterized protein YlxW (UPF0749 family)